MEQKTDVTDLIPKGLGAYWLVFFVGVLSIGLLEFGYFKMSVLVGKLGVETIAPLDVAIRGSILAWTGSMLLVLCGAVCLLNFRLGRRHQDPPSRTNAWFWSALFLFFLGMDVQVAIRETLRDVLVALSGATLYQGGTLWWLTIYAFILAVIGTRLFLEMTVYAPAMGLFLLAVAGAVAGTLIDLELVPIPLENRAILMLKTGIQTFSILLLFLAFSLFARRQVFRDREVVLRWFAKTWNQPAILASTVGKQVANPPAESKPRTETTPPPSTDAAKPSTGADSTVSKSTSGISSSSSNRPLVQKTDKPADVVPFRAASKKSDQDSDFDLTGIA